MMPIPPDPDDLKRLAHRIYVTLFLEHEIDYSGEGDIGVEEPYAIANTVVYPKAPALIEAAIAGAIRTHLVVRPQSPRTRTRRTPSPPSTRRSR